MVAPTSFPSIGFPPIRVATSDLHQSMGSATGGHSSVERVGYPSALHSQTCPQFFVRLVVLVRIAHCYIFSISNRPTFIISVLKADIIKVWKEEIFWITNKNSFINQKNLFHYYNLFEQKIFFLKIKFTF